MCPTWRRPFLLLAIPLTLTLAACGGGSSGGNGGGGGTPPPPASQSPFFAQWGFDPQHDGAVAVAAQALNTKLADIVYDPMVAQEQAESGGGLLAHYSATLTDGNDFYMETKSGAYPSCNTPGEWQNGAACGPNAWNQINWNVTRYTWESGTATSIWTFGSDWKPETNGQGLNGWEPVFHPVLANSFLYVPGAGGTIWKINKDSGQSASHVNPFQGVSNFDANNSFVSGPLTADANGNIFYNVVELSDPNVAEPWFGSDVRGAWLVKVTPQDATTIATYSSLVPGAPPALGNCPGRFTDPATLPWPPDPAAVPNPVICGSQRPGVNVAPAIGLDGTIYTVSRAHFASLVGYLVAVNPDLTPKWQASLQNLLNDGCGILIPIASDTSTPNTCRPGTTVGVDPTTNAPGSGQISDEASSSPTVLPDGSILYGAITRYNQLRGHSFKFDANGNFQGAFDFGWDSTPAVYPHGGTYSIVIKDNYYDAPGLYCFFPNTPLCQPLPPGPFFITQLDANLNVEWQFQNTTIDSLDPNGYEWCVNAPLVDANGVVYGNSEDGNVYSLPQGNSGVFTIPQDSLFLQQAIGAAYTPLSLGPDGKVYAQNDGHLFVIGN